MRWYGRTDVGSVRERNEDALWAGWSDGAFTLTPKRHDYRQTVEGSREDGRFRGLVADGMGGGRAGDEASYWAAYFAEHNPHLAPHDLLLEIHHHIFTEGLKNRLQLGMATTGVVLDIAEGVAEWAHVGDSRLYHLDGQTGELTRLTKDHSLYQEMVDQGSIQEGEDFPRNIINHILGRDLHDLGEIPSGSMRVESGDMFLLCTDGMLDAYDDAMIEGTLLSHGDIRDAVDEMVERAVPESRDNVTVLVVVV